ncbi:MAG: hypothetical protein DRP99_00635 [Candidatus Latescibacterota bacterium]|nr:MAG: hypothetical protein DRP99_00635 [Candidatus Latescibacterota bacterium]
MLPRERLRREAEGLISRFLERIRHLRPRCVVLFGSYARGDFTEGSDLDLCVVARELPEDELARRTLSGYCIPKVRAVGFFPDEFMRFLRERRFFVYDIVSEGIPIYDDGFFEKAREVYSECLEKFGIVREPQGWRVDG